jgi:hypothetical protein
MLFQFGNTHRLSLTLITALIALKSVNTCLILYFLQQTGYGGGNSDTASQTIYNQSIVH